MTKLYHALILVGVLAMPVSAAQSQSLSTQPFDGRPVERVVIAITNPAADQANNDRITDIVRRTLGLYPGAELSEQRLNFAVSTARRTSGVADISFTLTPGGRGGVDVDVSITRKTDQAADVGRGALLSGDLQDFPLLYDLNGTMVRAKLETLGLYYANNNAWYGRPDLMLNGNPLVQGAPAGKGWDDWVEAFVHYGLYGITPLSSNFYVYGGVSAISAGSVGQELFTDRTRGYTGVEDAYAGFITGQTDEDGNRLSFNFSAGRQRFTLANAFLIANTAANGEERAALQANARWAGDFVALAQLQYNSTKIEAFYVDPDELPLLDSRTKIAGVNVEGRPIAGLFLGASYLTVPESITNYFGPLGSVVGTREGLDLIDVRFTWSPNPPGQSGPFFGGEVAHQSNRNFDMDAWAAWGEVGYSFADLPWSPSVSYRLSYFSGDDPTTATYERWDPLLSGGNGEQWVQGANHFKVVQDSNVIAHRVQARLRVSPTVELVPQLWAFYADETNNIGGNPALSVMNGHTYGYEANITAKWFASRNLYVHGHVAYTVAGNAVENALGGKADDWLSTMLFVRYAF